MINQTIRHLCVASCWAFALAAANPVLADPAAQTDGQGGSAPNASESQGAADKVPSCKLEVCNILANIKVAGDGLDTTAGTPLYLDPNNKTKSDALNTSSASESATTVSFADDGILHKDTFDLKGAVGYITRVSPDNSTWEAWIDPYARVDIESTSSTVKSSTGTAPVPTYSQENYEFGGVVQYVYSFSKFGGSLSNPTFGSAFISFAAQPYYEKDLLRKSELYGLNTRVTPYWDNLAAPLGVKIGLNKFTSAGDKAPDIAAAKPAAWQWQWALIAKGMIDGAHFTVPGTTLAGYYPNLDYTRIGGTLGGAVRVTPGSPFDAVLGSKPITFAYYVSDFAPLSGYNGNFAHATGTITFPVTTALAIKLSYVNGRTEGIAAPENKISISLSIGGS